MRAKRHDVARDLLAVSDGTKKYTSGSHRQLVANLILQSHENHRHRLAQPGPDRRRHGLGDSNAAGSNTRDQTAKAGHEESPQKMPERNLLFEGGVVGGIRNGERGGLGGERGGGRVKFEEGMMKRASREPAKWPFRRLNGDDGAIHGEIPMTMSRPFRSALPRIFLAADFASFQGFETGGEFFPDAIDDLPERRGPRAAGLVERGHAWSWLDSWSVLRSLR